MEQCRKIWPAPQLSSYRLTGVQSTGSTTEYQKSSTEPFQNSKLAFYDSSVRYSGGTSTTSILGPRSVAANNPYILQDNLFIFTGSANY